MILLIHYIWEKFWMQIVFRCLYVYYDELEFWWVLFDRKQLWFESQECVLINPMVYTVPPEGHVWNNAILTSTRGYGGRYRVNSLYPRVFSPWLLSHSCGWRSPFTASPDNIDECVCVCVFVLVNWFTTSWIPGLTTIDGML